jgi:hypothetical protein
MAYHSDINASHCGAANFDHQVLLHLQATPDHFVLVGLTAPAYKRIGGVVPGDIMWVAHSGANSHLVPAEVMDVRHVSNTGLYAPLTLGGSVLANGVAASVHR